jgi:hypothetical protein
MATPKKKAKTIEQIQLDQTIIRFHEESERLKEVTAKAKTVVNLQRRVASRQQRAEQKIIKLLGIADKWVYQVETDSEILVASVIEVPKHQRIVLAYKSLMEDAIILLRSANRELADAFEANIEHQIERMGNETKDAVVVQSRIKIKESIDISDEKQDEIEGLVAQLASVAQVIHLLTMKIQNSSSPGEPQ